MKTPRISIVTIVRNDRPGLERTLASVRKQSYINREWIIIDGASTDETSSLVHDLFRLREAIGVSEGDRGIYDAMNKGLDRANGDYVIFLNAGDSLFDPNSLALAAIDITTAGSPDIAFFASMMDFGGRLIERPVKPPSYIWHGQPGLHQATFFRRTLHLQHRFNDRYKICGDYDVLARMSQAGASMQSFAKNVSVNTFDSGAASGRNKLRLAMEAFDIQTIVLKLSFWKKSISFIRRSANSSVFKILTSLRK
jgi:putative colanic acid biosynthesis glycosyltransferase